jgi:hypothetical protein
MAKAVAGIPFAYASPLAPAVPVPFPRHGMNQPSEKMSRESMKKLLGQGYTRGLVEALCKNKRSMPLAY